MVEAELLSTLQSISYIAGATGVCIAAFYYMMILRSNEKIRRRDLVFQRLQASQLQFFEAYWKILRMQFNSVEELREKYLGTEYYPIMNYVMNHFNALGILMKEGLATPEQIFQQYSPMSIISIYEKFRGLITIDRLTPSMEVHNPDAWKPFEMLYLEAKKIYPNTPKSFFTKEELLAHARRVDELLKAEIK